MVVHDVGRLEPAIGSVQQASAADVQYANAPIVQLGLGPEVPRHLSDMNA